MSVVALASLRGAPGVTATALMTAAALKGSVLVEGDFSGGVLAVRYDLGREPGLATFAAHPSSGWKAHAQPVGHMAVMVGPDAPQAARTLWTDGGLNVIRALAGIDETVLVDAGRLDRHPALLAVTDVLVIVIRPVAEHLVALKHQLPILQRSTWQGRIGVALAGDGLYEPRDLVDDFDVDFFAPLPTDAPTVSALEQGQPPEALRTTKFGAGAKKLAWAVRRSVELSIEGGGVWK